MVDPLAPRVEVPKGHVKQRELARGLLAGEKALTAQSWQVPAGAPLPPFLPPPLVCAGSDDVDDSPVSLRPRGGETVLPAVDNPLPAPHKQAPSDSTRPFWHLTHAPRRHDEHPGMLEQVERLVRMVAGAEGEGALLLLLLFLLLLFCARALGAAATSSKSATRHAAVASLEFKRQAPRRRRPPCCGLGGVGMMALAAR